MASPSAQEGIVTGFVSSTLVGSLLQGIYTTVYVGTAYLYTTRKSSKNPMVLAAITALYALNAIEFGIGWSYVTTIVGMVVVGMVGEPVIDSFAFVLIRKSWARLLTDICTFLLSIVADGLIIWRCYKAWGNSLHAIIVPLALVLSESRNIATGGGSRYAHILDILVQSASLHVVGSLAVAIPLALPLNAANALPGMAPTLMVARVALASDKSVHESRSTNISSIEFGAHDTSVQLSHITAEIAAEN